jgi:hypothetical protein
MDGFMENYSGMILNCTSYFDAKENAYHMLFLGMCLSLTGMYKVTSNLESGAGRHDIRLEALTGGRMHIVLEFKQGRNTGRLKETALKQIVDKKYYTGLKGKVLCIGIAHNAKKCEMAHRVIEST